MKWAEFPLGKIASIHRQTVAPLDIKPDTKYVGLEDIESGGRVITFRQIEYGDVASNKFAFSAEHILFGKLRPYLAKIACPDFSGICSTDIIPILPGSIADRRYIAYFLRQPSMVEQATSLATGANLPRLRPHDLVRFQIPLPPLETQHKIAAVLDKAQELIDLRKAQIEKLDEFLRSVFLDMFGDPVTNPKGWEEARFKEVAKIKIGPFDSLLHAEDYMKGGIPLINPSHIVKRKIKPDENLTVSPAKMNELKAYQMHEGDIVLGRRGEMGRCAVVTIAENDYLCGTGSMLISPTQKINPTFIVDLISSASFRTVLENAAQGITMKNLNSNILENIKIIVPSMKLQKHYVFVVEKTEQQKNLMQQSLTEMENNFNGLMQRAFRGELF